jgi:hypothetical protein
MTSLQLYYINILFFLSFLYNREYKIINIKMQYSTIQEAYNIDSLKPTKKSTKTASQSSNNSQPYNIENNSVASNKESVNYNSKGGSCSPIQAPTYNIPISGDCKKERDSAMKTYIEENFKAESANGGGSANASGVSPSAGAGNSGNILTNRQDNIMPFYDEDMEQYFDINNLTDEVGYKSNDGTKVYNYMPNHNKNSYTNNNTGEYSNSNNTSKNGVNLLNTSEYNLSTEERKKAQEALEYLKSIEDKINNDENRGANETLDKIRRSNDTGPGGFGKATFENKKDIENEKKAAAAAAAAIQMNSENENKLLESIKENKKTENIFNMIINIFIFVFIGAFIILICDYITELAIQIGSTKTSNVLEPYIKYNIYMQHHFQHLHNMQMQNMPNMPMPNMPMQMPMQNMPNMPMPQNQGYAYNIPEMPSPMGIAK